MPLRKVIAGVAALCALALLPACAGPSPHAASAPGGDPVRFRHPGVVVGAGQLATVRTEVRAHREPWASAFRQMSASRYAAADYTPHPSATVACQSNHGTPACVFERDDAVAAYTQALLWSVTGQPAHARKAVQIMDAWSAVVKRHTLSDADLQSAWTGSSWVRAAELVHATYPQWREPAVMRFKWMLRKAYLPDLVAKVPDYNGNWELAMTDAEMGMAVFLEDHRMFAHAVSRFRARVPAYFYLSSDGRLPKPPPGGTERTPARLASYWFGQRTYADGLGQETCRNFMHIGYSLAATAHIAETAWHQGVDLYGEQAERLRAALEFHARYQLGARPPSWLCGGKVTRTMGPDLEVAYNHLHGRLHLSMPQTARLVRKDRPAGTDGLFVSWETLTHADNPGA
ncbi:alginate lyase family protein [Streptomyces tremellae]|uniref:Alginate lyase family protein n=1 Tax=Streptomyces tremellae TaxID=1124239 RepID=A0ABP7EV15_9ACTN